MNESSYTIPELPGTIGGRYVLGKGVGSGSSGVVYVAPKAFPDLTESEAADPTFALPGEGGYGVRLDPGRGLFLAPLDCIG